MWYVGKFDEANWNLFARLGLTPSYLRDSGRGMAAVQQTVTYKRELLAGDIVEVRSRLLEIRDKSVRFVHEMRNGEPARSPRLANSSACIWTGRRGNLRRSRPRSATPR